MKKLILLAWIITLSISVYGQALDTITDRATNDKGKLDRVTKSIGLNYKLPKEYVATEEFDLKYPPANPVELLRTTFGIKTSKWIHEDKECVIFIRCTGMRKDIDKSIDDLPENVFSWIRNSLKMGYFNRNTTDEQMEMLKKIITIWTPQKSKEVFNAHYVITYPIKEKKAVYQGKYRHRLELIMTKWGESLTISFLLTKKGNRHIDKYIKDVEGAFWFDD
ncbi:hypothetical protein [Parabacteroides sp. AM08-6]|uniref:hypothetical protein n=1 Tax=Parabacteroides sp. AM08-6 TaxID=2292053 RepID=UPI000EFFB6CA|nr:hypothetical protein [Parabacteroides sp. AM08-6]RHJ76820.1 hypothetical protein DW103_16655 [Parabacteroides sp. AM08-6]